MRMREGEAAAAASPFRYGSVAILLHWLVAALIVVNLSTGLYADRLGLSEKAALLQPHKISGILILLLSLFRLAWRLGHRPEPAPNLSITERILSRSVHMGFYVLMILIPIVGWTMASASPFASIFPIDLGLFNWPMLPIGAGAPWLDQARLYALLEQTHRTLAYMLILLLGLHVLGALRHQFSDRSYLGRMIPLPGGSRRA